MKKIILFTIISGLMALTSGCKEEAKGADEFS